MRETLWLMRKTMLTTFKNYKNWLVYLVLPVVGILLATLIYSGTDDNRLPVANQDGEVSQIVSGKTSELDAMYIEFTGKDFQLTMMQVEDQSVSNNMSRQSIGYLIILMLFSAVSLSSIIIKEKENRTYHRLLSAPISSGMYVASNVIVNFLVMMLQIGVTLFVMSQIFKMNIGVPIGLMFVILVLFALVAISLSFIVIAFTNSSMEANALQNLIIIPTSILAGCLFPIEMMPLFIQKMANFLPQYWLLETINELQQGRSISHVSLHLSILLAFALTFTMVAIFRFGRSREQHGSY